MIEIRWHGRGGQGSFTAAKLLGAAVSLYQGRQALAFPSFGPERRGAPVLAFTKIDDEVIQDRTEIKTCDYIVILDETLFSPGYLGDLKEKGILLLNSANKDLYKEYPQVVVVDAGKIAKEIIGRPITNTAMLGALAGVSGQVSLDALTRAAERFFSGTLLSKNLQIFERAYALGQEVNHEKTDPAAI